MSDQLRSIYARWERLEDEKRANSDDLKELFLEAKGNGYDPKALRVAFRMKAMDASAVAEFAEHEALVDVYLDALGVGTKDAPRAHPRIAREEPNLGSVATVVGVVATPKPASGAKEAPAPIRPPSEPDDDIGIPAFLRREPTEKENAAVAAMIARGQ